MATVSAATAPAAVLVNVSATSDTAGPMNPTPCVSFRTVVTDHPLAIRESASVPAKMPLTAMVAHGSALIHDACARLTPTTCLKYSGIHASRMKYPQLFTKFATMHAHTGALDNNSLNGTRLLPLPAPPLTSTFSSLLLTPTPKSPDAPAIALTFDLKSAKLPPCVMFAFIAARKLSSSSTAAAPSTPTPASVFSPAPPPPPPPALPVMRRSSPAPTLSHCAGLAVAAKAHTAAHAMPSTPKNTNGPAMPPAASIAGAASSPTMLPLWNPPMHAATARERSALGTHLAVRLFMHGSATPSPSPITARVSSSSGRLVMAAYGVAMVAMDHSRMPAPSTALPP
mmetsp:Transcript_17668/g.43687  ORF Transcript_17668/g.43687 Transcript_17668/m.43687 type:complete len:341 (-) Transcript_17668:869-1891(-)